MSCKEFDEKQILLFAYGELDSEESERLSAHLSECADCRGILDEIERVRALVRDAAMPALPSAASLENILNYARRRIRRQRLRGVLAQLRFIPSPRLAWAAAAVVVLAVAVTIFMVRQNELDKKVAYDIETVEEMMAELSQDEESILWEDEEYEPATQNLVASLSNIDQELKYFGINGGSEEESELWQEFEQEFERMEEYLEIY